MFFPNINDFPAASGLQAPKLLGQQVPLQVINHEHFDLENQAFQTFEEEIKMDLGMPTHTLHAKMILRWTMSFGWIHLPLGDSLPVTGTIAKHNASRKLITMASKLLASDLHTSAYAFDLVPHNFHGKWLFVDFMVGRCLLLPMTLSSSLGTLTLPTFNFIQLVTSQLDLLLIQVVSFILYMDLLSLQVHCHKERPVDINIHCFSLALL